MTRPKNVTGLPSDLAAMLTPTLAELTPYRVPSRSNTSAQDSVRLDSNELPIRLDSAAQNELATMIANTPFHQYPRGDCPALRTLLADQHGVDGDQIVFGNGSGELISLVIHAFSRLRPGESELCTLYPAPSFSYYRTASYAAGARPIEVDTDADFQLPYDAMVAAIATHSPHVIFFARPNNPTGTLWERATIEKLVEDHPQCLFVIDEAYIDYAEVPSMQDFVLAHDNCVLFRTLSKLGLASLRVGYAIASPAVADQLEKIRPPYNIGGINQLVAHWLLTEQAELLARARASVIAERARVAQGLENLGVKVFDSAANLVIFSVPDGAQVFTALRDRGVYVRYFPSHARLQNMVRVTIGTPAENDAFLRAVMAVLSG